MQHVHQLVLILGLHDGDIRNAAQVREIEETVVRGPVVVRKPGAIHAENDRQVLQGHVVDDLVVGALQEGRVDGDHRLDALGGETGRKQDGMLLGDADVEELTRAGLFEVGQTGAAGHGAGDAHDLAVGLGEGGEGAAEYILVVGRRARRSLAALARVRVVRAGSVEFFGGVDGCAQAAALLGQDVQQDGRVAVARELEILDQFVEIVPVDRPEVAQAEFFEEGGLDEEVLRFPLPLGVDPVHVMPAGQAGEELLKIVMDLVIRRVRAEAIEVAGHGPDIAGD